MRVRIHFRGLVLFRFPKSGNDAGKLVAELISDPKRKKQPGGPHAHRAEIQAITASGEGSHGPKRMFDKARVDMMITGGDPVSRSPSFKQYVPKLADLVARGTTDHVLRLRKGDPDSNFVRNTIVVDRGQIRVKDVVIWDAGGFSLDGENGDGVLPSVPTKLKFLGSRVSGHMANECVVDLPDVENLTIDSPDQPNLHQDYPAAAHGAKDKRGFDTVEILITNYEPQRAKPTPWGMDFQWLFAAAGYNTADLTGDNEFREFMKFAEQYHKELFDEDWRELMERGPFGRPFPYVASENLFSRFTPINDIDSRPVCVPGDGGDG